jgi:hypothetical protein
LYLTDDAATLSAQCVEDDDLTAGELPPLKRKYYLLHEKDRKWHEYSEARVDASRGYVSISGKLHPPYEFSVQGDADITAAQCAPDVLKIKCVKMKFYMLHGWDRQWHEYSRAHIDALALFVSINGELFETGEYALRNSDKAKKRISTLLHWSKKTSSFFLMNHN